MAIENAADTGFYISGGPPSSGRPDSSAGAGDSPPPLFSGSDCLGASLTGSDCLGASFTGSDCLGASLTGSDCLGVSLTGSDCRGVSLTGSDCLGVSLTGSGCLGVSVLVVSPSSGRPGLTGSLFSDFGGALTVLVVSPSSGLPDSLLLGLAGSC
ncbi:MAG: pentapeptide repeat-containing protein [Oscillibacter sp.]|nr:pentapeptide repeat-containing protein [Oscillibacter sp.]